MATFTLDQVRQHNTASSCWVIIRNAVYDVTKFLSDHPGGKKSILIVAGKDATEKFDTIHPEGTLEENLNAITKLGELADSEEASRTVSPTNEKNLLLPSAAIVTPQDMLNLHDFEKHAQETLSKKAWAYYFSATDDMSTKSFNHEIFRTVLFRPRIFRDIVRTDTSSEIVGVKTSLPLFVSPAALARLAHPDGEKAIARACGRHGILQIVSNNSSLRYGDVVAAKVARDQPFAFQLYVQNDRSKSEKQLRDVIDAGCKAVVLTLDAPTPGKRELDERVGREEAKQAGAAFGDGADDDEPLSGGSGLGANTSGGVGNALFQGTAGDLVWQDLVWLRNQLPDDVKIVLKGLQTVEDAVLAVNQVDHRTGQPLVHGILLSNHGGRALEGAPPSLLVLEELRLYAPQVFDKVEVYIDGGIRRGTDVVKALCLGAKQVGIGRPALTALAGGFGERGVSRTIEILRKEILTAIKLLGVNDLSQLGPHFVNTRQLDQLIGPNPFQAEYLKAKL
ncbi:FMN-dependent dehydrogenase-domain-containing protein [Lipomyces japonicus]|uniref:FMN-dependent dehydrogenase-domain-containing protein n=1 Tax=Lipomyces japonicus TaxID=56871 RepID=UPI0034CEEBA3